MEIEIAPDGRIFFNEYGGKLKIYHPDTKQLVEAGHIEGLVVAAEDERMFTVLLVP